MCRPYLCRQGHHWRFVLFVFVEASRSLIIDEAFEIGDAWMLMSCYEMNRMLEPR